MARHLHMDPAAEHEANDIGAKYMHSGDVIGDMSRDTGVDFSTVRIHADEAAAQQVAGTGVDAFSTGKDIFFGRGAFNRSDPASRGLLAHELGHSMQQGAVGGETAQSAPMGAAQGGVLDWFRGIFGKKKKGVITQMDMEDTTPADSNSGGFKIHGKERQYTPTEQRMDFMSSQSRALYEMVKNATPEQLRTDPMLRKLIMDDYKTNMAKRLKTYDQDDYASMYSKVLRGDSSGEMKTFNMLIAAQAAPIAEKMTPLIQGEKTTAGDQMDWGSVDSALGMGEDLITQDPGMMEVLTAGMEGFGDSVHFTGEHEDRRSKMMMNSLVLRGLAPGMTGMRTEQGIKSGWALQKAINENPLQTEGGRKFAGLLGRLFGKKK